MLDHQINILWLYPDILNLHGDRGNIMALEKVAKMLDISANITKVESYNDNIDFENTDIIFLNAGELKVVQPIVSALEKYRKKLNEYVESNKMIIAIGTTGAVFAEETLKKDGSKIQGLSLLNMTCLQRENVYGNDIHFYINDENQTEIIGSQIQIIDTILDSKDLALGTIKYGMGNNNQDNFEGAKNKNLIFTNTLGPILVKNPWYAEKLIKEAMFNKGISIDKKIDSKEFEIELNSLDCIKKFINEKVVKS